jgi:hypothetical protein
VACDERLVLYHSPLAALQDVSETKGVNRYGQNVWSIYPIQRKLLSSKYEIRGERTDSAIQDVLETKGVSNEWSKILQNVCYGK